ncbi:MAG: four helix bundle protein [Verrucomicrobia bacterium]|nr:four helix bundle protein [Verrucomicrobiota bacterium]
MNYPEWLKSVPATITEDPLWNQEAYRLALFAADLAWHDSTKLFRDARTRELAGQLIGAVGSIGANISEGYSRGFPKDRARFYEYSLGSARETRTWYFDGRHILGDAVADHRMKLQTQIIRMLLATVPVTRGYSLHENEIPYTAQPVAGTTDPTASELDALLSSVPMPEP